jgi:putative two-component system response regulator
VDVYDALTTDRPYRKALSREEALAIMEAEVKRGWWDGGLVTELQAMLRETPEPPAPLGTANHGIASGG